MTWVLTKFLIQSLLCCLALIGLWVSANGSPLDALQKAKCSFHTSDWSVGVWRQLQVHTPMNLSDLTKGASNSRLWHCIQLHPLSNRHVHHCVSLSLCTLLWVPVCGQGHLTQSWEDSNWWPRLGARIWQKTGEVKAVLWRLIVSPVNNLKSCCVTGKYSSPKQNKSETEEWEAGREDISVQSSLVLTGQHYSSVIGPFSPSLHRTNQPPACFRVFISRSSLSLFFFWQNQHSEIYCISKYLLTMLF